MPTRRIYILTQDGSIVDQSIKDQLPNILNDPDNVKYHYMEGKDWIPAYRLGDNLHPDHVLIFYEQSDTRRGFFVFTDHKFLKKVSKRLIAADKTRTSWEVVREFVEE